MRILIATDAFPPLCGGSGWSTYELANGLRARGHDLFIVRPVFEPDRGEPEGYDGFRPIHVHAWAPPVPFVRNYFKNERLYRRLEAFIADLIRRHSVDLVHAQHLLSGPPAIAAARAAGAPSVCTIRDYWPVCYWSDLIHARDAETLCPACSPSRMSQCVRPHAGRMWPLAVPFIPYMRANLARKRRSLARADVLVAVSGTLARDLAQRAPELNASRIEIIHNPVDVAAIRAQSEGGAAATCGTYAIYVGKLEPNKGVRKLLVAIERANLDWPLIVVGEGSERPRLEAAASASGRDVRFVGWRPRAEALAWMRGAELLVFPSHGPESLSRVLLEASALGTAIAAMDTGGTREIVVHDETGLLSRSAEELGDHVARLRHDAPLRTRLGEAARRRVERLFDSRVVIAQVEALYRRLTGSPAGPTAG
jgi:glycogen synthase